MDTETKVRTESQRLQILNLLRSAGNNGVTNVDLVKVALRYSARIQEMYVAGYEINVEELAGGLTNYVLVKEPETKKNKPDKALNVLIEGIKNKYNGNVSVEQLIEELNNNNFTVRRNIGTFC
jgi:predicted ATP-grasp superfamily ATP-dependent carboligase